MPIPPDAWKTVSTESLPTAGQPVLLRLKDRRMIPASPPPPPARRGGFSPPPEPELSEFFGPSSGGVGILKRGVEYGFAVAVLRYDQDGFGRPVPMVFRAVRFENAARSAGDLGLVLDASYPLDTVEAWMAL